MIGAEYHSQFRFRVSREMLIFWRLSDGAENIHALGP